MPRTKRSGWLVAGAGGYFAPFIREYMRRSNAPDDIGSPVLPVPAGGNAGASITAIVRQYDRGSTDGHLVMLLSADATDEVAAANLAPRLEATIDSAQLIPRDLQRLASQHGAKYHAIPPEQDPRKGLHGLVTARGRG